MVFLKISDNKSCMAQIPALSLLNSPPLVFITNLYFSRVKYLLQSSWLNTNITRCHLFYYIKLVFMTCELFSFRTRIYYMFGFSVHILVCHARTPCLHAKEKLNQLIEYLKWRINLVAFRSFVRNERALHTNQTSIYGTAAKSSP